MREAGLPAGVLNVVPGTGPVTGRSLTQHPGIALLDLTGGTETGRMAAAAAASNLAGCIMELGGKAPVLVFPDADLEQAVNGAAFAMFVASGQTCIAGTRLLVHCDIFDQFVHKFLDKVRGIKLGDPIDPTTQVGCCAVKCCAVLCCAALGAVLCCAVLGAVLCWVLCCAGCCAVLGAVLCCAVLGAVLCWVLCCAVLCRVLC